MSIFSPCSSVMTARTRAPIGPMQAPLALSPATLECTAILVRWPASRARAAISTEPSAISGTSSANSLRTRLGWVRDRPICGPLGPRRTRHDEAAQPLAVDVALARHLLGERQDALDRAEVDGDVPRVGALLDDARDDVALAALEVAHDRVVLEVAQPLDDDLAGGRGGDAAEAGRGVVELGTVLARWALVALLGLRAPRSPRAPRRRRGRSCGRARRGRCGRRRRCGGRPRAGPARSPG